MTQIFLQNSGLAKRWPSPSWLQPFRIGLEISPFNLGSKLNNLRLGWLAQFSAWNWTVQALAWPFHWQAKRCTTSSQTQGQAQSQSSGVKIKPKPNEPCSSHQTSSQSPEPVFKCQWEATSIPTTNPTFGHVLLLLTHLHQSPQRPNASPNIRVVLLPKNVHTRWCRNKKYTVTEIPRNLLLFRYHTYNTTKL